ncbi:hypothetical protein Pst134EB_005962 [Puccinia striiformis f. sp. tritici]|nr:hypothetical protein Pst134EB_005962 [Puccinia striiformis f. sp. tritici]
MSNTRSTGQSLLPIVDPEALLRTAAAERRRLAKIFANSSEPSIHVPIPAPTASPSTSIHVPSTSHPSTSFHTPATSPPGTPSDPPFTPSLLRTNPMTDVPSISLPGGNDPPKDPAPPKKTDSPKGGGSSSSKSASKNPIADHYVELLLKLQHTAAVQHQEERLQLQEERRLNLEERRADRERIARLENTLFDVVTKAEEEKQERASPAPKLNRLDLQKFRIANGPPFTGPPQEIEPFLKWIQQLQIFFSTKNIPHDDDRISVAGGLIQEVNLLGFFASEGSKYLGKSWDSFKKRLFKVALPQLWRTTLKSKLRQLSMGPTESFITFSGRARTLQTLINFDDSTSTTATPTHISDFDLAEFVVLGVSDEIRGEIIKFALLDVTPFVYSTFEKRTAVFDKVTVRKPNHRAPRVTSNNYASPDPIAWRVHAYLDSQGQCHHCKTTCGSAPGACTKPLNKKWVDIPDSFQTPRRPQDYTPPKAHGPSPSTAGKPTHAPAGRPPFRSSSLAAVTESPTDNQPPSNPDYVDVVEAIEADHQLFDMPIADDSLPPDLTQSDWDTFQEIDDILADNVAGVGEDESSECDSTYCSDLGRDPFDDTPSSP